MSNTRKEKDDFDVTPNSYDFESGCSEQNDELKNKENSNPEVTMPNISDHDYVRCFQDYDCNSLDHTSTEF